MTMMTAELLEFWRKLAEVFETLSPSLDAGYDRTVARQVFPTASLFEIAGEADGRHKTANLTGSIGTVETLYTVPDNKLIHISIYSRQAVTVATEPIGIVSPNGTIGLFGPSQTASYGESQDLWLGPKWIIGAPETGDAGDTAIKIQMMFREFPSAMYETNFS